MSRLAGPLRFTILALCAVVSMASSRSTPKDPTVPAYGAPPGPAAQNATPVDTRFWCHGLAAGGTQSSLCFPGHDRCERERQAAAADGVETSACAVAELQPACFQLGGDPNPSQAMCARTVEDCELWRQIDADKNGAPPPGVQQPCALATLSLE